MRNREGYEKNSSAGAFIIGAAIGAVAALLFAPFSGRKMRRITKEKGREALDKAKRGYSAAEDTVDDAVNKTKKYVGSTKDKLTGKMDELETKAGHRAEEAGDEVEEMTDEMGN